MSNGLRNCLTLAFLASFSTLTFAVEFDLREGVTDMSQRIQDLHHLSLAVCVVVGIIVFGAMFYSIVAHRRSRHPKPADFHESLLVEIVWTTVPILILVGLAIPATTTLLEIEDNSDPDLTILITASQWKWHYQYLEADIGYYSNLTTPTAQINNLEPKGENYLLEVDNPLVLPTNKKVRFLTTSNDVIHSWWVPDFAVKQDAIPGFINEAWARLDQPGLFRGQCAELCGKDHAYMPVVVEVRLEAEFDKWIDDQRLAKELSSGQAVADRNKTWTMEELMPIGEQVFLPHCATCHESTGVGQGVTYPALAGGEIPNGPLEVHIDLVMNGKGGTEMQSWAPQLSDRELAAVITYERNAWGNSTNDVVQPKTIYATR
ncbi:MAG: cytochrome c oxidase subunit II [Pseudomonadales bacterium]|nr:cytochrome c oxidase subunit II [Pseudomonadales bacterium]